MATGEFAYSYSDRRSMAKKAIELDAKIENLTNRVVAIEHQLPSLASGNGWKPDPKDGSK